MKDKRYLEEKRDHMEFLVLDKEEEVIFQVSMDSVSFGIITAIHSILLVEYPITKGLYLPSFSFISLLFANLASLFSMTVYQCIMYYSSYLIFPLMRKKDMMNVAGNVLISNDVPNIYLDFSIYSSLQKFIQAIGNFSEFAHMVSKEEMDFAIQR